MRKKVCKVLLTEIESQYLMEIAKNCKMPVSRVLRMAALDYLLFPGELKNDH